jgi:integrase
LTVRQAVQRFGGDPVKRRALVAERRRLLTAPREADRGPQGQVERQECADALTKVRAELAKVKTSLQFVEPKSARSRRTIALPAITVAALRTHRRAQLEARLLAGDGWKDSGLVFTTSIGTPIENSNLTKSFKALLRQAKLPDIRIHDLRHTAATLLLTQGVNPRVVMETLGHSQISLTLNTYSHVLPDLQREAADRMSALLAGDYPMRSDGRP